MLLGEDMYELEVEEDDGRNPAVQGRVRLHIGVLEHALDNEDSNADK